MNTGEWFSPLVLADKMGVYQYSLNLSTSFTPSLRSCMGRDGGLCSGMEYSSHSEAKHDDSLQCMCLTLVGGIG